MWRTVLCSQTFGPKFYIEEYSEYVLFILGLLVRGSPFPRDPHDAGVP
jgi:hypothetical protein